MNARIAFPSLALAMFFLVGCHHQTPAEKAAAEDAQGRALVLQGDYPQAIKTYTKAIQTDATIGSVYFHRGTARILDHSSGGTSNMDDAIADFTMAIKLDPKAAASAPAYHGRGDAKHLKGDEAGAQEDWARGSVIPK